MKTLVTKILGILLFIILMLVGIGYYYLGYQLPNVGEAEELKIERTQERLERGAYLANHVMVCMDCHSTRDWGKFSGPPVDGTAGQGGEVFDQSMGFPGRFVAPNITPFALGNWTDGEIFRAITTGVNREGKALFPVMPHPTYGTLDKEDIYSIIVYLRQIAPVESVPDNSKADFPMSLILNTIPQPAKFTTKPKQTDQVAWGAYLTKAAACSDCHTKQEKGKLVGEYMAGGFEFKFPDGRILRSPNITPDSKTGIGQMTEEAFVQRFRQYADSNYHAVDLQPNDFQTVMPWVMYGKMEESDLKAIYAYLRSIKAVNNKVERLSKPVAINH